MLFLKKNILKIGLLFFSIILSILVISICLNYYLKFSGKGMTTNSSNWMLDYLDFDIDKIFWSKSFCDLYSLEYCKTKEEKILSTKVSKFYPNSLVESESNCKKILFLGDSFTNASWVDPLKSYPSIFSLNYSMEDQICIHNYRLSAGGASNGQELLVFSEFVKELNPDLVFWQFYWNDMVENPHLAVYKIDSNGDIKHRKAWKSMRFIAGFLNQKIPFFRKTTLGNHIMYLGENGDPFHFRAINSYDFDSIIEYNHIIIPKLLSKMEEYSEINNFKFYTTLAPLECQYVQGEDDCFDDISSYQNNLREFLKENSNYVSMEYVASYSTEINEDNILSSENNQYLFNTKEDKGMIGTRHLSEEGNIFFGQNMYKNFTLLK